MVEQKDTALHPPEYSSGRSFLPDFKDLQYRWLLDIFQPGRILCAVFTFRGWRSRSTPHMPLVNVWDQLSFELKELTTS